MQRPLIDGRYVLGDTIGGGGMAEVYLARDEVLGRDVALKVLRGRYANDEEFVERFRREAKNAAALNHASIVQVYDQGQTGDGAHYIAMEYVPGGTLAQRIKEAGPLDPGEAAGVAARVAEALAVAHARGIIHRDIKPQNVLLTTSGDAKVADFGIARAASAKTITETSLIMGTAAYMSPEQVRGERVGPGSDLYSLGVVLYEMLTGEPPYSADNPLATAMKHLEEPPRHPRDANPAVPQDLDALTAKLLAKRPEDRYASATALAEDLGRIRAGLPPLAAGLGQQTTARMPRDTGATRVAPAAAPGSATGRRSRQRGLLPLAALLLGVLLLGSLAWALSSGLLSGSPSENVTARVEVPEVVGLSVDEARGRLEGAGLRLGSQRGAASDEIPEGEVIEQSPKAGAEADQGSAVDVIVSTGSALESTTQPSTSSATSSATASPASSTATATASGNEGESTQDPEAQQEAEKAAKEAEKEAKEQQKEQKEAKKPPHEDKGKKKK